MRVVMLAPEVHPYAKTGGLADVLAALPAALNRIGVEVSVCLPAYRTALRALGPLPVILRLRTRIESDGAGGDPGRAQRAGPDLPGPCRSLLRSRRTLRG